MQKHEWIINGGAYHRPVTRLSLVIWTCKSTKTHNNSFPEEADPGAGKEEEMARKAQRPEGAKGPTQHKGIQFNVRPGPKKCQENS